MSNLARNVGIGVAAAGLIVGGVLLVKHLLRESPILVQDGSLILVASSNKPFTNYLPATGPRQRIVHPDANWKLKHFLKHAGPPKKECKRFNCRLVVTLNNGSTVILGSTAVDWKGLYIQSSVDFDSADWNKTDPHRWVLGDASSPWKIANVTIDGTDDPNGTVLCSTASGCEVEVHYN